jgi:hypothetical protein
MITQMSSSSSRPLYSAAPLRFAQSYGGIGAQDIAVAHHAWITAHPEVGHLHRSHEEYLPNGRPTIAHFVLTSADWNNAPRHGPTGPASNHLR